MDLTLAPPPAARAEASPEPAAPTPSRGRRWLLPVALLAFAALVYRPWASAPFSVLDFSEFLPVLREGGGFAALARYFAGHGRSAWATYAWIALNWSLFGGWSPGWDLLRFALMSGVGALAFVFLRRLGCSAAGAAAGVALLVVATPAQEGWTRLTGEPLGLAALLGAALLALGYRGAARWAPRAAAIALLLGVAVLAKEVLAVCALPVLLLAVCWRPGQGLGRPEATRRNVALAAMAALAVGAAAGLVLWTLRAAPAAGYAQSYGNGALSAGRFAENLRLMVLPITRSDGAAAWAAGLLLGGVALAGWALLLRDPARRGPRLAGLLLAALVPVLGALVYLPWPRVERFYGYPFLIGAAILLAVGVSALRGRVRPLVLGLPLLAAFALAGADAAAHSDAALATRQVDGELARALGSLPGTDTVFVGIPPAYVVAQAWQGPGPTLRRYAIATGVAGPSAPPVADTPCQALYSRYSQAPASVTFISYAHLCGPVPGPAVVIERRYGYVDLLGMRSRPLAVRADLWLPAAARPAASPFR